MRAIISVFSISSLFLLLITVGLNNNNSKDHISSKDRDLASISINGNCFAMMSTLLKSKDIKRTLISMPSPKKWIIKTFKAIPFNFKNFLTINKIDFEKVDAYRKQYELFLNNNRTELSSLGPNSIQIESNTESILGFIYAINSHRKIGNYLSMADAQDLNRFRRIRLIKNLNQVLSKDFIFEDDFENILTQISWDLMGKETRGALDEIFESQDLTDAEILNIKNSIQRISFRELTTMGLEKTTFFKAIARPKQPWYDLFRSVPIQTGLSTLSWFSLFHGLPILPWIFKIIPKFRTHKLSNKTIDMLMQDGFSEEYMSAANQELRKNYGKHFYHNTFFKTADNYEKFRYNFQRYAAPLLPIIAIWMEYRSMLEESTNSQAQVQQIDALSERLAESVVQMHQFSQYGITLVEQVKVVSDATRGKHYQVDQDQIKRLEANQAAHTNLNCRRLKSCLMAQVIDLLAQESTEVDVSVDPEYQLINEEKSYFKMCKSLRDSENDCSNDQLKVYLNSTL